MLRELLIKTVEQQVLAFFAGHPNQAFYGREIAHRTGLSLGAVSKALRDLHSRGLLLHERKGKTTLYTLNETDTLVKQFKVMATLLALEPLVEKLKGMTRKVVLFGSAAKGTNDAQSDIDLFIETNEPGKVLELLTQGERKLSRIQPVIRSTVEASALEEKDPVFFKEVHKGIILWERPIDESRI